MGVPRAPEIPARLPPLLMCDRRLMMSLEAQCILQKT